MTGFEGATGQVDYRVDVVGDADVRVRLTDAAGAVVAEATGAAGTLSVADVVLWKPGAAYLYQLTVEARARRRGASTRTRSPSASAPSRCAATSSSSTASRSTSPASASTKTRAIRGKGHDDAYMVHDFQLMEWSGANSFRTSHYPYAEEVLEFADRHGVVVIDETAAVGLNMGVVGGMTGTPPFPTFSEQYAGDATHAAHAQHLRELIGARQEPPLASSCGASRTSRPRTRTVPASTSSRSWTSPASSTRRARSPIRCVMFATFKNDQIVDLFDVVSMNRYYGWYIATGDLEDRRDVPAGRHPGLGRAHRQADHDDRVRRRHAARPALRVGSGVDRGVPVDLPRDVPPRVRPLPAVRRRAGVELRRLRTPRTASTASTATRRASSPAIASPSPPPSRCAAAGAGSTAASPAPTPDPSGGTS